ncbi:hypothetical protein [Paracoccus denitrificans]|uniref:hypothetical protein n=1 Tax=Paracoccus denitrificans TaxID=266 RepID=UPI00336520C7
MLFAQQMVGAMLVAELIAAFFLHGEPRPPISFGSKLGEVMGLAFLLHLGGFWK